MGLTTAGKNNALDGVSLLQMGLHTADPTDNGSVGEASGGSPAYSRQSCTFAAAAAGARALSATVTFDVPAGIYTHYSIWNGATCVDKGLLSSSKNLSEQGQIDITTGTVSLT